MVGHSPSASNVPRSADYSHPAIELVRVEHVPISTSPNPRDNRTVQLALLSLLLVSVAVLAVRAVTRERRQYGRFKRLTNTRMRQRVYGRWLREAFLVFGGLSAAMLLASYTFLSPTLQDARRWPPVAWLTGHLSGDFGVGVGVGIGIAFVVLLVLPVILLRRQLEEIPMVGDISALLPRNRSELVYTSGLALNAGLVEELLFRFGMPALIFGITGDAVISFAIAALLFGLLHLYQGWKGMLAATILGLIFTVIYVLTGSIVVVMIVHALIDLRSLVLIPVLVNRVHRANPTGASRESLAEAD
ncbi:MAG: family intrarane metalloprotease [Glaciihabitans sp.]|nr:family intrarane metalloprotease [Glaciihabitans sp.]